MTSITMPLLAKTKPIFAFELTMRMFIGRHMVMPTPTADPLMAQWWASYNGEWKGKHDLLNRDGCVLSPRNLFQGLRSSQHRHRTCARGRLQQWLLTRSSVERPKVSTSSSDMVSVNALCLPGRYNMTSITLVGLDDELGTCERRICLYGREA